MGWDWKGVGSGAMSGAGTGAMFGPWGAAAGGLAGGALGGLKGGDKEAPKVEDFYGAATPTTNNPLGGQQWSQGPDGKWTSNLGFTGQAGEAFQGLLGGMNSAAGMDPAAAGQAASDKMYGVLKGRLDPQWQQNQGQFGAKMANSGLEPGTEAFDNASRSFGNQQNDAYSQASGQAIGLGQAEQAQARQNAMQPFLQAQSMMGMLGQQGNQGDLLKAAGMAQKANDNAADRATAGSNSKKGGAGSMLGGSGGKKGGGGSKTPSDQNAGYNENLGGYNF
jgi:hypothetical protein